MWGALIPKPMFLAGGVSFLGLQWERDHVEDDDPLLLATCVTFRGIGVRIRNNDCWGVMFFSQRTILDRSGLWRSEDFDELSQKVW